jgi:hypothetical protein
MACPNDNPPNHASPPRRGAWETMSDEFRALGGAVENIVLRPSSFGRGLFPIDPAKPFLLRVPDNLLFRLRDVAFEGDCIRINEDADTGLRERSFFERYQSAFSWGGGGRVESAELIDMFDSLPSDVRELLTAYFGMSPFIQGDRAERIRLHFLRSRMIPWGDESLLVPFIDLIHGGSNEARVDSGPQGGVQIEGEAPGEILLDYGHHDPLGFFNKHGLAAARLHAFSLPMQAKIGSFNLVIGRDPRAKTERAGFGLPEMQMEGGTLHLSYLTVGNSRFPRVPRGIFYTLMREAEVSGAEDAFDRILFYNRTQFLKLIEALEPSRNEIVTRLRRMAHFQLEALAQCVGTREL